MCFWFSCMSVCLSAGFCKNLRMDFNLFDAMLAQYAVALCLSVRLSQVGSSVRMAKHIIMEMVSCDSLGL